MNPSNNTSHKTLIYNCVIRSQFILLILSLCFTANELNAQKPQPVHDLEILHTEAEKINTQREGNRRIDLNTGVTRSHFAINQLLKVDTPEKMALNYLSSNMYLYGLQTPTMEDLVLHAVRTTDAGKVVRFRQHYEGYPVNKAEVTVSISPDNYVRMLQSSYVDEIKLKNIQSTITETEALSIATDYIKPTRLMQTSSSRLMIYHNEEMTRLAHEVMILASSPQGQWHVFVDAQTGEIFKVQNMLHYNCGKEHKHSENGCSHDPSTIPPGKKHRSIMAVVDGSGQVFDPDPLSSNTVAYGGNFADNNDATNVDLDNSRFDVVLRDIEETNGVYKLLGPYAEISDHDAPNKGLFTQNSSVFDFNREQDGFEAVTCYFHIDSMMRYINLTLGCEALPYQYNTGVLFDPSGANGADNSFYSSGAGTLTFGEGCVDDGEDSDVIHHELGHFLHDMVTSGGLSQNEGLSEGCGDYIAQSYNRSLGYWQPSDNAYNWVFNWDGHNECWNGRVTNNPDGYPAGLGGGLHADGTLWSSCMMDVWDAIGRDKCDKIFHEGLGMTNGNSNQDDAANAVYQAAINLGYDNADLTSIHNALSACGYDLPILNGPPVVAIDQSATNICLDDISTIEFFDVSSSTPPATSRLWTFEGGTPATSTDLNPVVTYATEGIFDVSLEVTNANGTNVLNLTDHITTLEGANCPSCDLGVNNTVVVISESGANNTYTSVINNPGGGIITDVNITNITGIHTYLGDLTFSITSPAGTIVQLNEDVCGTDEDFNVGFDDQAASGTLPCPYTDGMLYIPFQALSIFNGEDAAGDWTLTVLDDANLDGGELQSWSIEICKESEPTMCDDHLTVVNPINGDYYANLSISSDGIVQDMTSVSFTAGDFIELLSGFEVEQGADFTIEIGACPN